MSQIDEHVTEMAEYEAEHESQYSEHSDEEEQELGARASATATKKKPAAKKASGGVKKPSGEERKRKKNYDSFATFIAKLVESNTVVDKDGKKYTRKPGFSAKGMEVLESVIKTLSSELAVVATALAGDRKRQTLDARDFKTALTIRAGLIARQTGVTKSLTESGLKAVERYQASLGRPVKKAPAKKRAVPKKKTA